LFGVLVARVSWGTNATGVDDVWQAQARVVWIMSRVLATAFGAGNRGDPLSCSAPERIAIGRGSLALFGVRLGLLLTPRYRSGRVTTHYSAVKLSKLVGGGESRVRWTAPQNSPTRDVETKSARRMKRQALEVASEIWRARQDLNPRPPGS